MLQSIKDKIGQLLDKNQSGFEEDDFMRLKAYIDLLFYYANSNKEEMCND